MKKQFLVILTFVLFACAGFAQTQKGGFLVGTSTNINGGFGLGVFEIGSISSANQIGIGFGTLTSSQDGQEDDKLTYSSFNISPNVGYFVADNFLIGTGIGFLHITVKDEDDQKESISVASISPMIRYYFPSPAKVTPFVEVRGGFSSLQYDLDDDKQNATMLGGKVGGAFFLRDKVSLDLFLDYTRASSKDEFNFGGGSVETKTVDSVFGFGLGLSVFL